MKICDSRICTGCGACQQACPMKCITLVPDELDALHPSINEEICISCGKCQKVCPNNNEIEFHSTHEVYVAWSLNNELRMTSASGGIASELYNYAIRQGWKAYGVTYTKDKSCHFIELKNLDDIQKVKNSKYCFSSTESTYISIQKHLRSGDKVLFVGLPCQVAGLYSFLGRRYVGLVTVDLLCHGSTPQSYLQQHINFVEKRTRTSSESLCFRDPAFGTENFCFSLYDKCSQVIYANQQLAF